MISNSPLSSSPNPDHHRKNFYTFHHPQFNSKIKDKIGNCLHVSSEENQTCAITCVSDSENGNHAIATEGFSSSLLLSETEHFTTTTTTTTTISDHHIFAIQINEMGLEGEIRIGWTENPTFDSNILGSPGFWGKMTGTCMSLEDGDVAVEKCWARCLPEEVTQNCSQLVAIFTFHQQHLHLHFNDEQDQDQEEQRLVNRKTVQFIVDGLESKVIDVSRCFEEEGYEIYPVVVLLNEGQSVQTISSLSHDELEFTSPKIEEFQRNLLASGKKKQEKLTTTTINSNARANSTAPPSPSPSPLSSTIPSTSLFEVSPIPKQKKQQQEKSLNRNDSFASNSNHSTNSHEDKSNTLSLSPLSPASLLSSSVKQSLNDNEKERLILVILQQLADAQGKLADEKDRTIKFLQKELEKKKNSDSEKLKNRDGDDDDFEL